MQTDLGTCLETQDLVPTHPEGHKEHTVCMAQSPEAVSLRDRLTAVYIQVKTLQAYPCSRHSQLPAGFSWWHQTKPQTPTDGRTLLLKGCHQSPACPKSPRSKHHSSPPAPCLLGESHVRGVKQELLPPVGAHQSHRLLIQPNLCHIGRVQEARREMSSNKAGLNLPSGPMGEGQQLLCCPCEDTSELGTRRGGI